MVARAVLDLGSNSFRALLADEVDGELRVSERLKEKVQLFRGYQNDKLDDAAIARGLDCVARFRQRLVGIPRDHVHVCGTHALRHSANSGVFVDRAEALLGMPLQVISGEEEARLIFSGVAHHLPASPNQRLVIDIGGGSTEFALGEGFRPSYTASVPIGCVSYTDAFFGGELITDQLLERARQSAIAEIEAGLGDGVPAVGVNVDIIGASGTIESIIDVATANGWADGEITAEALAQTRAALCDQRWVAGIGLPGLTPDRVDIFPAGVALVSALFDFLPIARMRFVAASMQEGILYEAVGRKVEDVQWRTVRDLAKRFRVDTDQVARVTATAQRLFEAVKEAWFATDDDSLKLLGWACELHEVGKQVAASNYHRHGGYVIGNGALRGFSATEQQRLAILVRSHRRGFPALAFGQRDREESVRLMRLAGLLRLAVVLERSRNDSDSPSPIGMTVVGREATLELPQGWLAEHALSRSELEAEIMQLRAAQIELRLDDLLL